MKLQKLPEIQLWMDKNTVTWKKQKHQSAILCIELAKPHLHTELYLYSKELELEKALRDIAPDGPI